jgi:hypothetical protein
VVGSCALRRSSEFAIGLSRHGGRFAESQRHRGRVAWKDAAMAKVQEEKIRENRQARATEVAVEQTTHKEKSIYQSKCDWQPCYPLDEAPFHTEPAIWSLGLFLPC